MEVMDKFKYEAPTALVVKVSVSSCILQASIPGYGDQITLEPENPGNPNVDIFGRF